MRRADPADAPLINTILNCEAVRPTVGGEGILDATAEIADRRNIWLFDERGGAAFFWRGPRMYEVHLFFIARGREALSAFQECLDQVDGTVWGLPPMEARRVRWFGRQSGFVSHGPMMTPEGVCELMVLEK